MLESIIASGFDVEELASALEPPDRLTVSEWADRHRTLDAATSAEPGPWRTDRTPYLRAIMDAFNAPEVETVVFQAPTQVGKTECLLNILGYVIDQRPGPTMVVYPTVETAEDISRTRIQPMINSHPRLSAKKLRDRHLFTTTRMQFAGMDLFLSGANSAASLASKPCEYVLLDEVNKYPIQLKDEADPISLAVERTKTFPWSRKIFIVSTPTTQFGRITTELEDSDMVFDYWVPCPHCGEFQVLKWSQVKWPKVREEDPDRLKIIEEAAHYECEACEGVIEDHHKADMLAAGEWRQGEDGTRRRKIGFRLSSLYSPWVKFGKMAVEFLKSKDFTEKLQNFVNGWLGEPFEIRDWRAKNDTSVIMARSDGRKRGEVPEKTAVIYGVVDVQEGHFFYLLRALLEDGSSALIDEGSVQTWDALEWIFWGHDYYGHYVRAVALDTGFRTAECYQWAVAHRGKVVAFKGATHPLKAPHKISRIDTDAGRLDLWLIETSYYKQLLLDLIRAPDKWWVHSEVTQDYCEQMVSEHLVERVNKRTGVRTLEWVLPSGAANHYWDLEVYWLALSRIVGVMKASRPRRPKVNVAPQQSKRQWIEPRAGWL
jgi:phage terminase large subunit GpA-like protein